MCIEVYKFGGTALATRKNFEILYQLITNNKNKKIIVVSAMGRSGFPYSTDSLLNLVNKDYLFDDDYHRLLSCGEIISSIVFNNYLNEKGLKSKCISYLKNGITKSNDIELDATYLKEMLKEYDYIIVPGFIAKNEENEVVTLGRGNSDLTAVLISKMFSLKKVFLFKDVQGIYPFLHYPLSSVKPYEKLTSKEAEVLVKNGVNTISLDALNFAIKNNITICILPYDSIYKGTIISISDDIEKEMLGFFIDNKTFKIICKNPDKIKSEMHDVFLKMHVLTKKEELGEYTFSFILKSSQNLLLKRKIIDLYFKKYFSQSM